MRKVTFDLPDGLNVALKSASQRTRRSENDIIRDALRRALAEPRAPAPRIPLTATDLGDPTIAERTDEMLEEFGSV